MIMNPTAIETAARYLHALQSAGRSGKRLETGIRPATPEDGWRIQRRISEMRGSPVAGWKCALPPSDRWIVAALHDVRPSGGVATAPAGAIGAARIEPELAFELKQSLPPRDTPYTRADVNAAIGGVRLAVEVLGCRYVDAAGGSGPELMADSLWHQSVVLGPSVIMDLAQEPFPGPFQIALSVWGREDTKYEATHPNGDPRLPLYWLAEFLRSQGTGLEAGQVVITGSLASVIDLPFECPAVLRYGDFGELALSIEQL
ncbi:fumarylacetoacetate hydrolase family protein [Polaromonas sp. P1(28)-8]|nr:fumarylacetoacetate hydrolase family protein [Polaromonas sp. P1(28)-8]